EIESLRSSLADRAAQIKQLRERVSSLEAQLTIAATAIAELHVENQLLRGDDPSRNITPMKRPNADSRRT
ncbi:MAG: hypothetical protein DI573_12305, partial [Microbacterium sp.]|uniref:hypothetical protein n=1 Tax=Microbacterium sp. TaxID=51671 RepID=UPI000DB82961